MSLAKTVASVEELFTTVRIDYREWNTTTFPWFRGEPLTTKTPLLPVIFREPGRHDENRLLQQFRARAPSLGLGVTPPREHTDLWLFLARHVGLPTRLLDWTEGLLIALLFALYDGRGEPREEKDGATVWMLDPVELNQKTVLKIPSRENEAPLAWINQPTLAPTRQEVLSWLIALVDENIPDKAKYTDKAAYLAAIRDSMPANIGASNVRRAWGAPDGTMLPVAVLATSVHPRVSAQKGCFTIHGTEEKPLSELVASTKTLRQYRIDGSSLDSMRSDLRMAGITYSTIFPDLDGLAVDLRSWY